MDEKQKSNLEQTANKSSHFIPVRLLDPKNDAVFQALFGDPRGKSFLISLLNAVIKPEVPFNDLEFLNVKLPKARLEERGSVVDVLVRLEDGTKINVEMQMRSKGALRSRALYYWSKIHSGGLQISQEYSRLKPTIVVIFLNEIEFVEDSSQYQHIFFATCITNPSLRLSGFRIDFIELARLPLLPEVKITYRDLAEWSQFLLNPESADLSEVYMNNKNIKEALERLAELSNDPEVMEAARQREMSGVLLVTAIEEAKDKGREEGKEMGKEEQAKASFFASYKAGFLRGMSIKEMSVATAVPEKDVEKYLKELSS